MPMRYHSLPTVHVLHPFRTCSLLLGAMLPLVSAAAPGDDPEMALPDPVITEVHPREAAPGERVRIRGSGFGEIAGNLSVGVVQAHGGRIPLRVVAVTEDEILAEMGPVPVGAPPGVLSVTLGSGKEWQAWSPTGEPPRWVARAVEPPSRVPRGVGTDTVLGENCEPADLSKPLDPRVEALSAPLGLTYSDLQVTGPSFVWRQAGLRGVSDSEVFLPKPPEATALGSVVHGEIRDGRLCLSWPEALPLPATLRVHAWLATGQNAEAVEVRIDEVVLSGGVTAVDQARRLGDVLEAVFNQQGGVRLGCQAGITAGDTTELVLGFPDQGVTVGSLQIGVDAGQATVPLRVTHLNREPNGSSKTVGLSFDSVLGRQYRIQVAEQLNPGGWRDLRRLNGSGGAMRVEEPTEAVPFRIYRVVRD